MRFTLEMAPDLPAIAQPSEGRCGEQTCRQSPAGAGARASATRGGSGRAGIGAVRAPAQRPTAAPKARLRSRWQSSRLRREQARSDRSARRGTRACVEVAIAVATAVAAMRTRLGRFGRKGHLCRHQTRLDERQAHPERQQKRQEQCAEPMLRRRAHDRYYGAAHGRRQGSARVGPPAPRTMTLDRVGQAT
jgi:hypothetical protein